MNPIPLSAPDIGEAEIAAVVDVLRSGRLSLGPVQGEFERAMADYVGTAEAVAVSSGTAGLHLALLGLGVGPGDEVLTPSFSFIASANPILMVGATPVFVDIDPATRNLDVDQLAARITERTKAILVVHVFGRPAAMAPLLELARRHDLLVIEDACEALGAEVEGRRVGSLGDVGVFGFYPNKILTTGEGGVLTTDDGELAAAARRLRNQGRDPSVDWFEHVELGFNYRLSEIACALGLAQLRRLPEFLAARAGVAAAYHERLADCPQVVLPAMEVPGGRISWFVFVVLLASPLGRDVRDAVVQELTAQGIGCGRYFGPIHRQPVYRALGFDGEGLAATDSVGDRALALPFHNRLTVAEVDRVCRALVAALQDPRPDDS